jgi:hypothetical protein
MNLVSPTRLVGGDEAFRRLSEGDPLRGFDCGLDAHITASVDWVDVVEQLQPSLSGALASVG